MNTWEYIGYSLTIPSGHIYLLTFSTLWTSGQPSGLGINASQTLSGNVPSYMKEGDVIYDTGTVTLLGGNTYYFFSKRSTLPTVVNPYRIKYLDIAL